MSRLEIRQVRFMNPDGVFELLDVLSASLSECCLRLAVPLFALFRSRIYLLSSLAPFRKQCQKRNPRFSYIGLCWPPVQTHGEIALTRESRFLFAT